MRALCVVGLLCLPLTYGVCQDTRSSLAHYRRAEAYLEQRNYISAANEFREALNGDLEPPWIEAAAHTQLGKIFDISGQHDRALNEYRQAHRASAPPLFGDPVQKTDPEYTEEARLAELEGTVLLRATIGEDGFAHDLAVISPLGLGLDEKAIEAVKQWHYRPSGITGRIEVDFRLPSKQSRWHLIQVQFDAGPGVSRPVFTSALYPIGAGLGPEAMEEGRLVAAMRRLATAKLTFEVDEHGVPAHVQIANASEALWGSEATAVVRQWRFMPATKNGIAATVPCTVKLVWGARELDFSKLAQVYQAMDEQPAASTDAVPGPAAEASGMETVRIAVDPQTEAAKLVVRVPPEYPSAARAAGLRGTVRLRVLIGIDGRVRETEVIDGDPGLTEAAGDSVKQWVYQPTLLNGAPTEVTTEADVDIGPSQ
jgi:TonB family protein